MTRLERCGAYYGTGVGSAVCQRWEGHPPFSEDRVGHSPIPEDLPVDTDGQACYTDVMTTTTIDLMTTVALTRVSPIGTLPQYTTNDGAIYVAKDLDGTWAVGPTGAEPPFTSSLPSLEAAVEFILGARALMAPADA